MSDGQAGSARRERRPAEEVQVRIEALDREGFGLSTHRGKTLRVLRARPGDEVRVRIISRRRGVLEGRVLERLESGPDERPPRCLHTAACGGCTFQELALSAQHRELHRIFGALLRAQGFDQEPAPVSIGGEPWHYRNKIELSFGARRFLDADEPVGAELKPRDFALGFHARGLFDKVIDVDACFIAFEEATPIIQTMRKLALAAGLSAWDPRLHQGVLRHLVLRKAFGTGQILLELVTNAIEDPATAATVDRLFVELLAAHPQITTALHGINSKPADTAHAETRRLVFGPGSIVERLRGLEFEISPGSFFQTNTFGAEVLYATIERLADPKPDDRVHDLYCGAGSIGLSLARRVHSVRGFEVVPGAVLDAERNARRNGITNASFVAGDVLTTWAEDRTRSAPTLLIIDPPRAGLHPKVLQAVIDARVPRMVYVSCNIRQSVQEIARLRDEAGYRLRAAEPVDLFPHGPHLEAVFALDLHPEVARSGA